MGKRLRGRHDQTVDQMADSVMEIVGRCAGHRLKQVLEFVVADKIKPLEKENADLREALAKLVAAKDEKDANGETSTYREMKAGAWERARVILTKPPQES